MFFLVIGIIASIPSFFYWKKHHRERKERSYGGQEWTDAAIGAWVLMVCCVAWLFFTVVLVNAVVYVDQVHDQEAITQFEANKVVYTERANDLTERLSALLETEYPEHEREIFENLTPQNADLVFVAYPQLRAIEGFAQLANQIKTLRDRIYEQDVKIEYKERSIRVRERNIFYLTFLLP